MLHLDNVRQCMLDANRPTLIKWKHSPIIYNGLYKICRCVHGPDVMTPLCEFTKISVWSEALNKFITSGSKWNRIIQEGTKGSELAYRNQLSKSENTSKGRVCYFYIETSNIKSLNRKVYKTQKYRILSNNIKRL
jgi:hypothetical protein